MQTRAGKHSWAYMDWQRRCAQACKHRHRHKQQTHTHTHTHARPLARTRISPANHPLSTSPWIMLGKMELPAHASTPLCNYACHSGAEQKHLLAHAEHSWRPRWRHPQKAAIGTCSCRHEQCKAKLQIILGLDLELWNVSPVAIISGATSCTLAANVKVSQGQKHGAAHGNRPRTPRGARLCSGCLAGCQYIRSHIMHPCCER